MKKSSKKSHRKTTKKKNAHKGKHSAEHTYGTGYSDHLTPLQPLDLSKIKNADDMAQAMSKTAFGARNLGEGVDVLYAMVKEKQCLKVLTLSGAMTVAKMGLVICDMIDHGLIDVIVSTGALMAHGFVEAAGMEHFKYEFGQMDDTELYKKNYDRVYDTLELEKNLDDAEIIVKEVLASFPSGSKVCSYMLNRELGRYLAHKFPGKRGVLKSAFEKKIPVYIPAFTDSEFGLDFGLFNRRQKMHGKQGLQFDPFLDLDHFAQLVYETKNLGIFTIGGGVPRNWAQQVAPYLDIIRYRLYGKSESSRYFAPKDSPWNKKYKYAVRICPEPVHWGGMSGCSYSEGVSWGKFIPKKEGGRWSEVFADATIAWPIMVKAVLERLGKQ